MVSHLNSFLYSKLLSHLRVSLELSRGTEALFTKGNVARQRKGLHSVI